MLDIGRESLDERLEMVVMKGEDSFSGRASTANNESAGITRFMGYVK